MIINPDIFTEKKSDNVYVSAGKDNSPSATKSDKKKNELGIQGSFLIDQSLFYGKTEGGLLGNNAEDGWGQLSFPDMEVQKKYMAVMSNTLSSEAFNKMASGEYDWSDITAEDAVTILDHIKIALMKGGSEISGYTDSISEQAASEILHSSAYAQALETPLSESSMDYMLKNDMEPTAENIFKAKYSVNAGTEKGDLIEESEQFRGQIEKALGEMGFPATEENVAAAYYLLNRNMAVTEEKVNLYMKLEPLTQKMPSEKDMIHSMAIGMQAGLPAEKVDITEQISIYEKADAYVKTVKEASQEETDFVKQSGKKFTIKAIAWAKRSIEAQLKDAGELAASAGVVQKNITEEGELVQLREKFSVNVCLKMMRMGFDVENMRISDINNAIDTEKKLSKIVEEDVVQEICEEVENAKTIPASVLGQVVNQEIPFAIYDLNKSGQALKSEYEKASQRYETMQTEPRRDLGDSITKAFRNVDDILEEMGRIPTEENRRAIRILGYNHLEITEENVEEALEKDAQIQTFLENYSKPGRVLNAIRHGIDLLHDDIAIVNEKMASLESIAEEITSYSKYLRKLEQRKEISEEERESYIGIYRLMHQIEKSDGAATGYVMASEAVVSLENLLSAIRSNRRKGMDYKITDEFGGVEAISTGKDIIRQIQNMEEAQQQTADGYEYEELKRLYRSGDETYNLLETFDLTQTSELIAAENMMLSDDTAVFKYFKQSEKMDLQNMMQELFERYQTGFDNMEATEAGFASMISDQDEVTKEVIREQMYHADVTAIDLKQMKLMSRQISAAKMFASHQYYQIPVQTDDGFALIHLRMRHTGENMRAEVSMDTKKYGRIEGVFSGEETGAMSVRFFAETESAASFVKEVSEKMASNEEVPFNQEEVQIIQGRSHIRKEIFSKKTEQTAINTADLYKVSKIFVQTVRNVY